MLIRDCFGPRCHFPRDSRSVPEGFAISSRGIHDQFPKDSRSAPRDSRSVPGEFTINSRRIHDQFPRDPRSPPEGFVIELPKSEIQLRKTKVVSIEGRIRFRIILDTLLFLVLRGFFSCAGRLWEGGVHSQARHRAWHAHVPSTFVSSGSTAQLPAVQSTLLHWGENLPSSNSTVTKTNKQTNKRKCANEYRQTNVQHPVQCFLSFFLSCFLLLLFCCCFV